MVTVEEAMELICAKLDINDDIVDLTPIEVLVKAREKLALPEIEITQKNLESEARLVCLGLGINIEDEQYREKKKAMAYRAGRGRTSQTCLSRTVGRGDCMHARAGIPFGNAAAAQVAREEERASATLTTGFVCAIDPAVRLKPPIGLRTGRAAVQAIALIKKGTKWQPGGLTAKDGKVWWCSRCNYKNAPRWRCGMCGHRNSEMATDATSSIYSSRADSEPSAERCALTSMQHMIASSQSRRENERKAAEEAQAAADAEAAQERAELEEVAARERAREEMASAMQREWVEGAAERSANAVAEAAEHERKRREVLAARVRKVMDEDLLKRRAERTAALQSRLANATYPRRGHADAKAVQQMGETADSLQLSSTMGDTMGATNATDPSKSRWLSTGELRQITSEAAAAVEPAGTAEGTAADIAELGATAMRQTLHAVEELEEETEADEAEQDEEDNATAGYATWLNETMATVGWALGNARAQHGDAPPTQQAQAAGDPKHRPQKGGKLSSYMVMAPKHRRALQRRARRYGHLHTDYTKADGQIGAKLHGFSSDAGPRLMHMTV